MQCKRTFVQRKRSLFFQYALPKTVHTAQLRFYVRVKSSDILEQLNDYSGWEYSLWIVNVRVFCMFFQEARGDTLQSWMVGRERTLIIAGDNLIVITIVTVPVSPSPPLPLCHFVEFHLCRNIIYSAIWYPTQFSQHSRWDRSKFLELRPCICLPERNSRVSSPKHLNVREWTFTLGWLVHWV